MSHRRNARNHVLLVSEDPEFLMTMSSLLHADGFTVAATSTAEEALATVRLVKPTVIVLDASGALATTKAMRRLRASDWGARLIVVGDAPAQAA